MVRGQERQQYLFLYGTCQETLPVAWMSLFIESKVHRQCKYYKSVSFLAGSH